MPIISKIKGKETVESRIAKLEGEVWNRLKPNLNSIGYKDNYPDKILITAFKEEQLLQVYAVDSNETKLIKNYPFTAFSGKIGPKLEEGDKQIPEGIYEVEYLNPNSSYYLSIKVNYPNEFDKSKSLFSNQSKMGGDIFIHGKSATIGCIPIGDKGIEELFLLVAKTTNKKIKIIISPRDFRTNQELPEIDGIEWEKELYQIITEELNNAT